MEKGRITSNIHLYLNPSRESLFSTFIHALGRDSVNFGSFVSVYFLVYRLSNKFLSRQPSLEKQVKLKAMVSGALSSMSILFLDKTSRFNFAVYSSIRALYTLWIEHMKNRDFIKRHSAALRIIGLMIMSGQLSYSVFIRPESVEASYRALVESVTGLTSEQIAEMRYRAVHGRLNMSGVLKLLEYHKKHGKYDPAMDDILSSPTNSIGCQLAHPGEGCITILTNLGASLFPKLLPFYFLLSLVPRVVFSPKKTLNNPLLSLMSILRSSSRTTVFMVVYSVICRGYVCFKSNMALPDVAFQYWIMGLVGGVAFAIESPSRQVEWFLYVFILSLQIYVVLVSWQSDIFP